ncbi:dethiobiotin synthase [Candidatus Marinamargulisbacteria bacterium SCGC AAA071-K20]|nr:dethiobiotin synthase [Candidatus Marinamargulisbacteria bacterium SCGC AAA071-K20]
MQINKQNIIFISGTDTNVGKTYITGLIAQQLQSKKCSTITQKWVQSGSTDYDDINEHLKLQNKPFSEIAPFINAVCPYLFKFPASPHLAAQVENKEVSVQKCLTATHILSNKADFLLIEGSGGLMVPLNTQETTADCLEKTKFPTILVVKNGLGCINHALLSIEALKHRQVPLVGLIFTQANPDENELVIQDNPKIVAKLAGLNTVATLSYNPNQEEITSQLASIIKKIIDIKG